jgi:hypothetical protein
MRRVAPVLALVLAVPAALPATAHAVRPPKLGNWEGTGSRGVAISFRLGRSGGRVDVLGGLTVSLPTSPVLCQAGPMTAAAVHYRQVGYGGPGSPPIPIFHYKPRQISLDVNDPGSFTVFTGRLRDRHTMVVHLHGVDQQPKHCGWPKRLRWIVHPRRRVPVKTGSWSGTISGADGIGGDVAVHVTSGGHVVDSFHARVDCPDRPDTGADSPNAEEFIHADGSFVGPLGRQVINGQRLTWHGRFAADTLTGTLSTVNSCTDNQSPLHVTFVAHPAD